MSSTEIKSKQNLVWKEKDLTQKNFFVSSNKNYVLDKKHVVNNDWWNKKSTYVIKEHPHTVVKPFAKRIANQIFMPHKLHHCKC